jgi:hypothetical protein
MWPASQELALLASWVAPLDLHVYHYRTNVRGEEGVSASESSIQTATVMPPTEVWIRIDKSVLMYGPPVRPSSTSTRTESEEEKQAAKRRWKRRRRWLDLAGLLFWTYVLIKVFFLDADAMLLNQVAPHAGYLLDFRIFFYMLAIVVSTLVLRWRAFVGLGYIAAFPLVVVLWKFPRFAYNHVRKWISIVSALDLLLKTWMHLRFHIVTKGLALFAALGILESHSPIVIIPCGLYLATILFVSLWRTVRASLSKSPVIALQDELITEIGNRISASPVVDPDMLREGPTLYSPSQVGKFLQDLSTAVVLNQVLYYWAYQLHRYRERVASFVVGALNYILLFMGTGFIFTLLNVGLIHLRPQEFDASIRAPGLMRIALYSVSGLVFNAGAGIEAIGNWAVLIRMGEGFIGVVFMAGLLLNVVTALRADREAADRKRAVIELKNRAAEQERGLRSQLHVSVEEAVSRLSALGNDIHWIRYLTRSIPADFFNAD